VIGDPIFGDPSRLLNELHPHDLGIEKEEKGEGDNELRQGKDKGHNPYGGVFLLVDEQEDNGSNNG
jgi:hypothetical protein